MRYSIAVFALASMLLCNCAMLYDRPPKTMMIEMAFFSCHKCGSLSGGIFGKGPTQHYRSTIASRCLHDWQRVTKVEFERLLSEHKADSALSQVKNWNDLRQWHDNYPKYDDGCYAEDISEFVTVSLARHWETLPALYQEIKIHPAFESFVLKHIDTTADEDNLIIITKNAEENRSRMFRRLCRKIAKNAQMAVKDIKKIDHNLTK